MASRSGVKGELVKPARGLIPSANDVLIPLGTKEFLARYGDDHREDKRRASVNVISGEEDSCRTTMEIIDSKLDTSGETVDVTGTQEDRTRATKYHRGATVVSDDELYPSWAADPIDGVCPIPILPNSSHGDGSIYRGIDIWKQHYHIADRNETRLEAKMFSDPTDYDARYGTGIISTTRNMLQIISLKLAKLPVGYNSVELYGMGSLNCLPLTQRILGHCGAIDITSSVLYDAVEATVEVVVSEVQISFNLCLSCFSSGLHDEIRLFDSMIGESRGLKRSVVAVVMGTRIDPKGQDRT
ncbi:hypothetical protein PR202_ga06484 [Eleusine coracana subsp. coracana]|uniref:DUF6598 domain-containing protein n=1 Tax=Eleusine coracana subsp. coracana TaxID=191504 RepID=A0AAV5BUZ3_ELECO|nr:hypothetical protein PR202_ga06484 [Eleusine coracana subsp. coracana]